jgi:hypothetical protein
VQDKQDQAYNKGNMNETGGYAKREISKQPKNNQNCCDYSKHIFISTRLNARITAILFPHTALMSHCKREDTALTPL